LGNLKLKLLIAAEVATEEEHIYAKVIRQSNVDEHIFLLRFTAVPPKAIAILNALRQSD
jgi:adenylate cyclase